MTDSAAKPQLRQSLLQLRRSIDVETWQAKSTQICQHLQQFPLFIQAKTVLAYFSMRQEPDLSFLFELPKTWGVPRCVGNNLAWHEWHPLNSFPLQKGAFGILEPHPEAPLINSNQVDLMLVPAVACDKQGYRLGYGGGFYDRLLNSPNWANKPTIGIVFDFAFVPLLPHDAWDQPLRFICTEHGVWQRENK